MLLRPSGAETDGPYVEKNESVAGYIILKSLDFEEAAGIAKECPILQGHGTSVEVSKVKAR